MRADSGYYSQALVNEQREVDFIVAKLMIWTQLEVVCWQ